MRVAKILMAYKNPMQLGLMIEAMAHPEFNFYIHLDKKIAIANFQYLQHGQYSHFVRHLTTKSNFSTS